MAGNDVWNPFEDSMTVDNEFHDPFETNKNKSGIGSASHNNYTNVEASSPLFLEDPFANQLPPKQSQWCRIPKNFPSRQRKTNHKRQRRRRSMNLCCVPSTASSSITTRFKLRPNPTTFYHKNNSKTKSKLYDGYLNEKQSDLVDDGENESVASDQQTTTSTIDTRVFQTIPSVQSIPREEVDQIEDIHQVAEKRAIQRLEKWFHETGLVDQYFLSKQPSTLSLNYSQDSQQTQKSQEGVEIGPHGITLDQALDIDQLIFDYRTVTQRNLQSLTEQLEEQHYPQIIPQSSLPPFVTNPRVNIARVLREADYFQRMEQTCQHLKKQLVRAKTRRDWVLVAEVAQDHQLMQTKLVRLIIGWERQHPNTTTLDALQLTVRSVRDLGNHLRSALLGGLLDALEQEQLESLKNLSQIVQTYESDYHEIKEESPRLAKAIMVVGSVKIALEHLLQEMEEQAHEIVQHHQEQAAERADDDDFDHVHFQAVMEACEELYDETEFVHGRYGDVFPASWDALHLWFAAIGSVASQYILQEIGGQEGNELPLLTPTQNLDILVWIEKFRNKFKDVEIRNQKATFLQPTDLWRSCDGSAKQVLAQVLAVLWDVHRLVEDQFSLCTQTHTTEWLDSVYSADHSHDQTAEGRLTTSLPEDTWILANIQLTTIRERFTSSSAVFIRAAYIVFRCMQIKQRKSWKSILTDVEMCCAASNDAIRMVELEENQLESIKTNWELDDSNLQQLEAIAEHLTTQFHNDAVFAAQAIHKYVFEPIEEELKGRFFEFEWEDKTHNEMAKTIVRTLEDFMDDLQVWLEPSMLRKTVDGFIKATVVFYIKHILIKAGKRENFMLVEPQRALRRIAGDITVLEGYFEGLTTQFPALGRILDAEFEVMYSLLELLEIGYYGYGDLTHPQDVLPQLQKKIRNTEATQFLSSRLWRLLGEEAEEEMLDMCAESEKLLAGFDIREEPMSAHHIDSSLELDQMILELKDLQTRKFKVKDMAEKVKTTIEKKAGAVHRRASHVISIVMND